MDAPSAIGADLSADNYLERSPRFMRDTFRLRGLLVVQDGRRRTALTSSASR